MRNKSMLISVCAVSLILIMLMPMASAVQIVVNASNDANLLANQDNETWQVKRNAAFSPSAIEKQDTINAGLTRAMNQTMYGSAVVNLYDRHQRGVITWNTSAIPDDATITSANVSIFGHTEAEGLGTFDSCIIDANPLDPMAYVGADYSRTNFTRVALDIAYGDFNTGLLRNDYQLNPTGISRISKTGYTTFMFTHSADVDNATNNAMNSTWVSQGFSGFEIRGMNFSAGAYTPYMTINYEVAVTPPVASFTTNTTSGTAPLTVQFNDTSSNSPTSWNWEFGDGTANGTTRNVTHTYTTANTYIANLTVANAGGSNTTIPGTTITVSGTPPVVNGTTTVGIYRSGDFFLKNSNAGGNADLVFGYGISTDTPLVGDWDASGNDTVGIYRSGMFFLKNSNTGGNADLVFDYGISTDTPLVGDWNGDGTDTVGIYRSGMFFLKNSNAGGNADLVFDYGISTDTPLVGDWNGDGTDTVGIYRSGDFFLKNSNAGGNADLVFGYGISTDTPLVGDWNGDGTDTVGIYRSGDFFLKNSNAGGNADLVFGYGISTDTPLVGDWDGL